MMPEGHGLRGLQMREARHDGGGVFIRALEQRKLQAGELGVEVIHRVADIELEVCCDLVVARARGMEPSGGRADQIREPRFHIHVDVFEVAAKFKRPRLDFAEHPVETRQDLIRIFP